MKYVYFIMLTAALLYFGCQKEEQLQKKGNECTHPIPTRVPLTAYNLRVNPLAPVQYDQSHCGYLPLGKNNYWVYRDSLFDYQTGQFQSTLIDTLRFKKTYQSEDSIIWWEPSASILYKGYFDKVYSVDTTVYIMAPGSFGYRWPIPVFFPTGTDSAAKMYRWDDVFFTYTIGKKISINITVPAGSFSNCFLFTTASDFQPSPPGSYRYVVPGVGIIKFKAINLQTGYTTYTSELLSYHIE